MADETTTATPQELRQQAALAAPPMEPSVDVVTPAANAETTNAMAPPEPKKRGRPHGAKETIKRTRKPPVSIRIEPLEVRPPEPRVQQASAAPGTPRPAPEPTLVTEKKAPVEIEEPKTPRTLLRETSRHLVSLRALVHDTQKAERAEKLTQGWATWPLV